MKARKIGDFASRVGHENHINNKKPYKSYPQDDNRLCYFPGCDKHICVGVPKEVKICTDHQIEQAMYYRWLAETFGQESFDGFSPQDLEFFFFHQGGCPAIELARYLKINENSMQNKKIHCGLVKAKKVRHKEAGNTQIWWMEGKEIVRVVDLRHNWVKIVTVASDNRFRYNTFISYVLKDKFGPYRRDLEGDLVIHQTALSGIADKYQKLTASNIANSGRRRIRKLGKITMVAVANRLGVDRKVIQPNIVREEISYEWVGRIRLTTNESFMKFVQDVVNGKCNASPKVAMECYKILKLSAHERSVLFQKRENAKKPHLDKYL